MSDHVHLVMRKHRDDAEAMMLVLQDASRQLLRSRDRRSSIHPVWGGPGWKVFLHRVADMERTIRYVEENPVKARQPPQVWDFVTPYDGWVPGLHPERKKP
jgi:REP element-mobilizing transposase RayT